MKHHKRATVFSRQWSKGLKESQQASIWSRPTYYDWATPTRMDGLSAISPSGKMRNSVSGKVSLDKIMHPVYGDPITNYCIMFYPEVYSTKHGWYDPHYGPQGGVQITRAGNHLCINSGRKNVATRTRDNGAPFNETLKRANVRVVIQIQNKLLEE